MERPKRWGTVAAAALLCVALPAGAERVKPAIEISADGVDLAARTLHFRLNKPAVSATVRVFSPEGALLVTSEERYRGARPGDELSATWPELPPNQTNFRIALRVTDSDRFWVEHEIVRFYAEIPHDEVVFETRRWKIRRTEAPKLDAALALMKDLVARYGKVVRCELYVAGFTDTVGSPEQNRTLSEKRARAIAAYFLRHGLPEMPVFARGFGEELLKVPTPDETPDERNRRAVYIVSAGPPEVPGPGSWEEVSGDQ